METRPDILEILPFLSDIRLQEEVFKNSITKVAQPGEVIVRVGQYPKVLPLVVNGSLRVFQQADGREALLYYVQPGETCMMSLISCFFNIESPTQAVADTQTEIICVPTKFIREWQAKYNQWNEFVMRTFQGRYNELLTSFNSVVFNNIENRIINFLTHYSTSRNTDTIPLTHLALANQLGTTRVVISRILKRFEQEGKVRLMHSCIQVVQL